jgi:hypothetical protein
MIKDPHLCPLWRPGMSFTDKDAAETRFGCRRAIEMIAPGMPLSRRRGTGRMQPPEENFG